MKLRNTLPRRDISCIVADRDGFDSRDSLRPNEFPILDVEGIEVDLVDVDVLVDSSLGRDAS